MYNLLPAPHTQDHPAQCETAAFASGIMGQYYPKVTYYDWCVRACVRACGCLYLWFRFWRRAACLTAPTHRPKAQMMK